LKKNIEEIYRPVKEGGEWQLRYNQELYQLYRSPDITATIKTSRLRRAGHVQRMNADEILKRIMDCKPEGRRNVGRSKLRWMDGVLEDLKKTGVKNWWTVAKNRDAWKKVLWEAEAHNGLQSCCC
jgi:hypothetical protein